MSVGTQVPSAELSLHFSSIYCLPRLLFVKIRLCSRVGVIFRLSKYLISFSSKLRFFHGKCTAVQKSGEKKICLKYIRSVQRLFEGLSRGRSLRSILIFDNEDVCESPVEGAFERNFTCEVEATKSIKHI